MIIGSLKITASSIYVNGKMTQDPVAIGNVLLEYIKKAKTNFDSYEEVLNTHLKEKKSRKTPERLFILKTIHQMESSFSVDTLQCEMNDKKHPISRATIYNALNLFLRIGIINKIDNQESMSKATEFEINFLIRN